MSSHYDTLNIPKDATKEQIKKAFRVLSLKHHPDKNNGNDEIFKKINEAYQVLSDKDKKKQYDMKLNHPNIPNNFPFHMGMDANEMMNNVFANMFQGRNIHSQNNNNSSFRVFVNGQPVFSQQSLNKPKPIIKKITISLEESFLGKEQDIEIERFIIDDDNKETKEKERIYFNIQKGIDNNEMIIIREKGNIIKDLKGDIKVFINIENHKHFKREGLDLIYVKELSLKEAVCGFEFELEYIDGKKFNLSNKNTITQPNSKKVIRGMGMKRQSNNNLVSGNLVILFKVIFPQEDYSLEAIKELKKYL